MLLTLTVYAQLEPGRQPGGWFEWRFTVKQNQVLSSNITAQNICRQRHRFEIDTQELPAFVKLASESSADVEPGSNHNFPVKFDTTGLAAGNYGGEVLIRCVNCKSERGCVQDRQLLHISMTVAAEQNQATNQNFVPTRLLAVVPFDSSAGVNATAKKLAAEHGLGVIEVHPLPSINAALIVFSVPTGLDVLAKAAELVPAVLMAQPDFLYRTSTSAEQGDSLAELQYGRSLIHADHLNASMTGKGVKIAIIDTGVDAGHPALNGKIAEQVDLTGMGFSPDVHGTLLAGIIAGAQKNGAGVSGIAPGAEILAAKACQPLTVNGIQAQCWSLTLAKALDYAIQKKARVVNMSLGGPGDPLLTRLVDEAIKRGIIVVAAAGNDGPHGNPSFPAALPNIVAVTAVDAHEQLYPDATQGSFIQVAAPGVEIVSTSPGGKLMVSSGTSMAAAFVTGTAALLLQQNPQLSPSAMQSLLQTTARHLGPPGKSPQFGSGLIDACQAIAQLSGDQKSCGMYTNFTGPAQNHRNSDTGCYGSGKDCSHKPK
jgi:subtilisin family serine protease